ncbi:helix-hairpin-helix domain-containing protein [Kitasatospora sp. NPDC052896]|uniref:helix-hairpin-helix domain-containing protein n=1 Tax=Kitasatospora sp. NPDC052896 TaxID=3364061 RepID=UPI0037C7BD7F
MRSVSTPLTTLSSTLHPVRARREEAAEVARQRMARLVGSPGEAPATAPGPPMLPDDWPHGYGPGRRRHPPAPALPEPDGVYLAEPPPVPGSAAPGTAPGPPAPPDQPDPPASSVPPTAATVPSTAPTEPPASVAVRSTRPRSRLPPSLQPLLWADRRALLGLTVLLLLAVAYAVQHFWLGRPQAVAVPVASATTVGAARQLSGRSDAPALPSGAADQPSESLPGTAAHPTADGTAGRPAGEVVVDVAGKVAHPGVLSLSAGSRVADAVRAAGGPLPGVDTDGLNLARVLTDGEQVLVGALSPPPGSATAGVGPRAPVSLNHATAAQLDALPGVGPVLAQHIVDYRDSHGGFRSIEQLRQVSGIGERKFADLKPLLTL